MEIQYLDLRGSIWIFLVFIALGTFLFYLIFFFEISILVDHISSNEQEDPNLFVYLSHLTPPVGGLITSGSAWVGTVCVSNDANFNGGTNNGKGFRASISLWLFSDLQCAEVRIIDKGAYQCPESSATPITVMGRSPHLQMEFYYYHY